MRLLRIAVVTCMIAWVLLETQASAEPVLRCWLTYAGSTQIIESKIVTDPYGVETTDVGGRFAFKAVVSGIPAIGTTAAQVHYINLYAYFLKGEEQLLISEAKYLPPFETNGETSVFFTGEQHLYAGNLERELIYKCALQETM